MLIYNTLQRSMRRAVRGRMKRRLRRHGSHCFYCNLPMTRAGGYNSPWAPSRDHKIPLARGSLDLDNNIVLAHRICNEEKGKLTVEEYLAWKEGRASRLDWLGRQEPLHRPKYGP